MSFCEFSGQDGELFGAVGTGAMSGKPGPAFSATMLLPQQLVVHRFNNLVVNANNRVALRQSTVLQTSLTWKFSAKE